MRFPRRADDGLLACFDKKPRVCYRRLFKDTVTQIKYVDYSVQCRKGALRSFADFAEGAEQNSGIDITLESDFGPQSFSQRGEIHSPINAQHRSSGTGYR
jgi:hypothetical protein